MNPEEYGDWLCRLSPEAARMIGHSPVEAAFATRPEEAAGTQPRTQPEDPTCLRLIDSWMNK